MDKGILNLIPGVIYEAKAKVKDEWFSVEEINFLNDWVQRITGWSREEINDNPRWWYENIHPEDKEKVLRDCRELLEGKEFVGRTYRFRKKDGSYVFLLETQVVVDSRADGSIALMGVWEDISQQEEYYEIFRAIDEAPSVGVLVYQDRVVYANDVAYNVFGYTKEELYQKSVWELVPPEHRDSIREVVRRRLQGEQFDRVYTELPILDKNGRVRVVYIFTRTIQWKGKPAGFVVFIDITKQKRYQRMFHILKDINHLMVTLYDERELLESICDLLIRRAGFRMAWVGVVDKDTGHVEPIKACGEGADYIHTVKISIDQKASQEQNSIWTALRKGKIVINPDTRTEPSVEPWKEEMLRRNFLSSCMIPFQVEGKTIAVLSIYSSYPNMFAEDEIELLREIQRDVSFALERIDREKFSKLINTAIELGHEWVMITDAEGYIVFSNKAVEEISGYTREELVGKTPRVFKSGYHPKSFYKKLWETIKSGKPFQAIFVNKKKDGSLFYLDQTITPVMIGDNRVMFVAFGKDITSEKYLEEQILKLKYTDPITGFPNRNRFLEDVSRALKKESKREHILFLIDIRDFSGINEIYGSDIGNRILRKVGLLLKKSLFERDIVGRTGGDEFGVLAKDVSKKDITAVIQKLFALFSEPINVNGKPVKLSVNVGASIYPQDATTAQELLDKASTALAFAKREGENTYRFFSKEITLMVEEHFRMKSYLERAIEEDRFLLFFQPIYRLPTLDIVGFESLMRLKDEEGKILTPKDFIELLEKTGLIRNVEDILLEKLRSFILKLKDNLIVAFNVSPKSFKDEKFVSKVIEVSKDVKERMILEITERLFVEDPQYALEFLTEVKKHGVKVAIDDFGTGYSSLAYLESLPVDIIKIDMGFVHRMVESDKSLAVVETIVELARRLSIKTIAEGVETQEQLRLLKLLGCNFVQGFLLSKPMSQEEVEKFCYNSKA